MCSLITKSAYVSLRAGFRMLACRDHDHAGTAGAQAAAIAETEQYTHLEAARDREQAPGLVLAHHQRNLLRLTEVINLGREIQSPQRHA